MQPDLVLYDLTDGIATLTLNRPEKRNALSPEMIDQLTERLEQAATDAARVVVLRAEGPVFSAGADLAALERMQSASYDENLNDSRKLANLFRTIRAAPYPVVGCVHGHAIAGGAGLVAACDYAVSVGTAKFGFTEVRIGFVPAIVMTFVLQRLAGSAARDLLLSGRLINGRTALTFGLVNAVVDPDQLVAEAYSWAKSVADETSAQAVAATKRLIDEISSVGLDEALDVAAVANARARDTADCRAGVGAFLRREVPPWKRRSS